MFHGEPVLAACANNGTHYLDCTGETPWHVDMITRYHEKAQQTGAIIIPQCGLDSVLADMLAYAVTSHIRKSLNVPTLSVTMSLVDFKAGVSGGTALTAVETFGHYPLKKLANDMKPFAMAPLSPGPLSKGPKASFPYNLFGLLSIPQLGGVQTFGPMAAIDVAQVHRSWGLYESYARKTGQSDLAYGPNFHFTEFMRAKNAFAGIMVKVGFGLFGMLMAFPLTRMILKPLIKKFLIPAPGEGPSKEKMKGDYVSYRALGVADSPKKEQFIGTLDCAHGGYMITGLTLSAAAQVILRGDLGATEAGRIGGGLLTPATLGEQYLNKLQEFGMKVDVKRDPLQVSQSSQ